MKAFYYVYDYSNHLPKVRHSSLELAQKEAERLTLQHSKPFEILKCVGVTKITKAETIMTEDDPKSVISEDGEAFLVYNSKENMEKAMGSHLKPDEAWESFKSRILKDIQDRQLTPTQWADFVISNKFQRKPKMKGGF